MTVWTLASLFILGVVIAIVDATRGGSSKTAAKSGVLGAESKRLAAGSTRGNPVPLGTVGGVWNGWRLRVLSVTRDTTPFLGPDRQRTDAGGQVAMVSIAASYKAGGYAGLRALMRRLYAEGTHGVYYSPDSGDLNCAASPAATRLERPLNEKLGKLVFSGHTVTGHLCFTIASNDARWLALYVDRPGCQTLKTQDDCTKRVWFSLRK